ncbi:uncharacterized protein MONOS_9522 [Monocercomonoides exilis]|uniref:uncharacterized protein n=1 Tax=Monocercomonoides exilis TaxID=2049356 RepID=UPI003559EA2F|nr:hypothetical protein MONOS_9522 [Monocercomonoides exilis]|eukprot:MONOS_9522.1-p1 / transcript=MONOS_9522.1 / gene=MONOS_9522 / organism=Monocercomonoides_exilis_PA203 / gene_product=unspecified product / transcript_product=unspecified product / location=Mono_scaffold00396:26737-27054(+) / protein_length=88 / sequence_SO=supercontig / SO=protein_coding / is_pseudo=false
MELSKLMLSNIDTWKDVEQELYLKEMAETVQNYQEHHFTKRLVYQSVWQFFTGRVPCERGLEELVPNEMHFATEVGIDLSEFVKCAN